MEVKNGGEQHLEKQFIKKIFLKKVMDKKGENLPLFLSKNRNLTKNKKSFERVIIVFGRKKWWGTTFSFRVN